MVRSVSPIVIESQARRACDSLQVLSSQLSSVDQHIFLLKDARQSRTTTITTTGYN